MQWTLFPGSIVLRGSQREKVKTLGPLRKTQLPRENGFGKPAW